MLGSDTTHEVAAGPSAAAATAGLREEPPHLICLQAFLASSPAIQLISLSYVDGRPIATAGQAPAHSVERVAAMASSFLALSETFAKEAAHGRCDYATITSSLGVVVAVRVPSPKQLFVLCAVASRNDNLAMVLRRTLDCAESLASVLH